jgi:hypothetical protein
MKEVSTHEIEAVSGGIIGAPAGPPLLSSDSANGNWQPSSALDAGFTTYRYDDGSTMTVNAMGDPVHFTPFDTTTSVSFSFGDCVSAVFGAVGTYAAAQTGNWWAISGAGGGTAGAAYNCVTFATTPR